MTDARRRAALWTLIFWFSGSPLPSPYASPATGHLHDLSLGTDAGLALVDNQGEHLNNLRKAIQPKIRMRICAYNQARLSSLFVESGFLVTTSNDTDQSLRGWVRARSS